MNAETIEQGHLISGIDHDFETTQESLRHETQSIHETRKMRDDVCWMYIVIAIEVVVIMLLIYIGLAL